MEMSEEHVSEDSWKIKTLIVGGLVGALLGLGAAFLFTRSAETSDEDGLPKISTGEALGVVVSIIGIVRGIAALGDGKKKK